MSPVHGSRQLAIGEETGLAELQLEPSEGLLPEKADFVFGKARVRDDVSEERKARVELGGHHPQDDARPVIRGRRRERGSDVVGRVRDLERRSTFGALCQKAGDHRSDTHTVAGIGRVAGSDDEIHSDEGLFVVGHDDEVGAVGEQPLLERGEVELFEWEWLRRGLLRTESTRARRERTEDREVAPWRDANVAQ